ncbi:CR1-alpha [Simian adenovirus 17]|uniref:CR1-alpha n=1 Tax=Simian adenovirus 17 TaxID=1715779 RepID=A0A2H4CK17_9ADEN|nr:CR1-alpha [Simian adenovirus 17]
MKICVVFYALSLIASVWTAPVPVTQDPVFSEGTQIVYSSNSTTSVGLFTSRSTLKPLLTSQHTKQLPYLGFLAFISLVTANYIIICYLNYY